VTFPLLSPQLFFVGVIGIISGFQAFGQIDILTQGGPENHTTTVLYDIYENVFDYNNSGKGAVMAIALFVILLVLTALQFLVLQRRVFYAGAGR
jgi:ABC-type sugar transport system permease subunit